MEKSPRTPKNSHPDLEAQRALAVAMLTNTGYDKSQNNQVPMLNFHGFHNALKLLLFTTASAIAAYLLAYELRFDFQPQTKVPQFTIWIGLVCLIVSRLFSYIAFKAINLTWRYFSLAEFIPLLKAHAASSAIFLACVLLLRLPEFPRSIAFIESLISLMLNIGAALSIRLLFERGVYPLKTRDKTRTIPTLILGGGTTGHVLVKTLISQPGSPYLPVAVLDDSSRLARSLVHGVPVLGALSQLSTLLKRDQSIACVQVAIPSLSQVHLKEIEETCKNARVEFYRLQSFEDLAMQRLESGFKSLPIEQILKREISTEYEDNLLEEYQGKTILVTGGAGSIGSEAVRQLLNLSPERILVLDNSEFHLFQLQRELTGSFPEAPLQFLLLDIRDTERVQYTLQTEAPDIVLHTAAYKHVPMSEDNPYSVFCTNVLGTRSLAQSCIEADVEKFILLSTDKAVDPANVMGCTKRMAELATQELMCSNSVDTSAAIVRFGNVVNSRGSVIPLFLEQIKSGGPITVTHPEVERYFMSIKEAVRLMLVAGTLGTQGEIYTLDMGDKIKILDVAREILRISGRPDISIEYTGLRPGEKITEELQFSDEELASTQFKKIQVIKSTENSKNNSLIDAIEKELSQLSAEELKEKILNAVQ